MSLDISEHGVRATESSASETLDMPDPTSSTELVFTSGHTSWRDLPYEIKVKILTQTLTLPGTLNSLKLPRIMTKHINNLVEADPELSHIIPEALYNANTISLFFNQGVIRKETVMTIRYPKVQFNRWVRGLEVSLLHSASRTGYEAQVNWLLRLAKGELGFSNLWQLTLKILGGDFTVAARMLAGISTAIATIAPLNLKIRTIKIQIGGHVCDDCCRLTAHDVVRAQVAKIKDMICFRHDRDDVQRFEHSGGLKGALEWTEETTVLTDD